jgi:hypothetical protein
MDTANHYLDFLLYQYNRPKQLEDVPLAVRAECGTCMMVLWHILAVLCELNLMEDILSTYYKCTLSAVTRKLDVSGHMLLWSFFRFGMWNSCPKFDHIFQLHPVYRLMSY